MSAFQYTPEWQGPLSGRSFEKQTEDAINGLYGRCDEILEQCTQPASQTSSGQMTAQDKQKLDNLIPIVHSYIDGLFS